MVESYKYKSKIATAVAFIAMIIVSLGKEGLTQIIPEEYVWTIPVIVGVATWVLAQKTEDHRVEIAEQLALENQAKNEPEMFDNDAPVLNDEYIAGDAEDGC